MKKKIVIVEDEYDIQELLKVSLTKESYDIKIFQTANSLKESVYENEYDLMILDLMLPDADGLDLCKEFKMDSRTKDIPIILLTAKSDEFDKVLGLELGADDYITKPFSVRELVARVKAVLRRYKGIDNKTENAANIIRVGNEISIDQDRYEVRHNETVLQLTKTEFKILSILSSKIGRVFSRDQLLERLWGNDKIVTDRTIDVHIKNLRDKLGSAGHYVKNIKGIGYKIEE